MAAGNSTTRPANVRSDPSADEGFAALTAEHEHELEAEEHAHQAYMNTSHTWQNSAARHSASTSPSKRPSQKIRKRKHDSRDGPVYAPDLGDPRMRGSEREGVVRAGQKAGPPGPGER